MTDDSMIERVARVLWKDCWKDVLQAHQPSFDEDLAYWEHAARAAIDAMRDPTGEMKDAGAPHFSVLGEIVGQPSACWRDMIDAALK